MRDAADTTGMMISDEQVRRAVEYLRKAESNAVSLPSGSDPAAAEIVDRVVESLKEVPDVRVDRIAHARLLMAEDLPSADELASKLIGRVLSDSVR
ncbi:MAG: hypothetical protein ACYC6J_03235 [Coriobacteriia bacterium]